MYQRHRVDCGRNERQRDMIELPIETILRTGPLPAAAGETIGHSRDGRPLRALILGRGSLRVSLIGGCHADEPVGPAMLRLLARYLGELDSNHPLLEEIEWRLVPHVNPDGALRNRPWSEVELATSDHRGQTDRAYDPVLYVRHVVRELPGDDIEFGFPRDSADNSARPENLAVARFLEAAGPLHLHGSFHGMGLAPGPWFLIERDWIDRTPEMRRQLRRQVSAMGYPIFDVDRRGEKGFERIDQGFSTRPDSGAMRDHFLQLGDQEMAARFRPSSMELVRSLGGDPLTLVSEMPLFLVAETSSRSQGPVFKAGTEGKRQLQDQLRVLAAELPIEAARTEMTKLGVRAMPIRDQMRLQLAFLQQALNAVRSASLAEPPG